MNENEQYELNGFSLAFKSPKVEGEFLQEVAQRRWPVLIWVFAFDVFCFSLRFVAKLTTSSDESDAGRPFEVVQEMGHQLANMAMLYVLIGLLNKRARTAGNNAARQEEVLLSICMGLAICNLLASLRTDNAQDYVYVSYFLICTSTFLKIRWWVGTGLLATPMVAVQLWYASPAPSALLPPDAVVHIVVAWAVGGLMAYLSDWYRRQMYANARLACAAHEKEMMEATARIQAQRELAAAQAQAAQRALTVAREKAAHEAKSEFMSLMCHEVRTPLNGCLASAEMLLETPLKEEQRELANTIRVSGSILLSTVSNFLDFFKLEAGKRLDIVRSEVMLGDLVGDVHCIIEAMIGRGGATALQQPQLIGVPQYVCCDPDRLRGILLNLYTNAAKFTKRGHIVLRVRSVLHDYTPPAPPGYSAILLQPSYHPSSSSHRSMDLSSCVLLSPATEPPVLQQQQQRQQQLGKPAAAQQSEPPSSAPAQQAATAATDSGAASNTHLQQQQQQAADVDSHNSKAAAGAVQPDHQQQQGQPFWQQASQWAMKVLPNGQVRMHSNRGAAAAGGGAVGSAGVAASSSKADTGGSSSKGAVGQQQYDVHAMSSSSSNDGSAGKLAAAAAAAGGDGAPAAAAAAGVAVSAGSNLPGSGRPGRSHTNTVGNTRNSSSNRDEACWLLFEVEDTGVGITRDGLATLFREYVQGTEDEMCKPRTRGGTGLGLSICSKQVGVLGGIIGAHSCKGQGSTFWFKIPTYSRPTSSSLSKQQQQHQQQQQQQHDTARHQQLRRSLDRRVSLDQHLLRQSLERQRVQDSQQQQQQSSMVRAGSSASSSNTGTYSVMHSGLYQSSSSTSSSNLTTPNEHNKQQQQQQLEGDRRQAGSAAAAATAATAAATLPAPGADSSCDSSSNGGAAAATSADASNKSSTQTAVTPAAPKPPQHPGAAAAAAAGTPAAAATTAAPAGSSSTGGGGAAAAAAAVLPRQSLSFDGRAPPPLDTAKLAGRRVLLAEDNLINQTVARKMLSSLGMQVEVAMNGLEALNAVQRTAQHTTGTTNTTTSNSSSSSSNTCGKEQPFSIVLMDMAMPVMGGVEATRKIRSQGFTLPIVAMTANASDKDRDECAAAGMNGFLSKPVLRDQLARALLAAVEEYETQQQQQQQQQQEGCNSGRS